MAAIVKLGLNLSLLGYDPFIPDMIPGRVQTMNSKDPLPTDEFFIRWVEASALMPIMQFSYFPWNYDSTVLDTTVAYATFHKALQSYMEKNYSSAKTPLFRPLFYADTANKKLYSIGDQFMLGPDIFAAPVLKSGATSRQLYIPKGDWIDGWSGKKVKSGLHKNYPASCPGMPIFIRASNKTLLKMTANHLAKINRGSINAGVTTSTYVAGLDRDLSVTG
jgi:alpha-glucosidase (family GH31 glycosyl hydrolase)